MHVPLACPLAAGLQALCRHGHISSVSSVYKRVRQHYFKIQLLLCSYGWADLGLSEM